MKGLAMYRRAVAILLVASVLNLLIACSGEKGTDSQQYINEMALGAEQVDLGQERAILNMQLPMAAVIVHSVSISSDNFSRTVEYSYSLEGQISQRTLTIDQVQDEFGGLTFITTIIDDAGLLKWQTEESINPQEINQLIMIERTLTDEMAITRNYNQGDYSDIYELNGNEYSIDYNEWEIQRYFQIAEILQNNPDTTISDADQMIVDKHDSFVEFIGVNNTLNGNVDGLILGEMFVNNEFTNLLNYEGDSKVSLDPSVEELCKWAERALIKCAWGAWANPICHVAVGTTAACWIAEIVEACE